MKLKNSFKIQKLFCIITWLLLICPLWIITTILSIIPTCLLWVLNSIENFRWKVGNKLLRISDEANDGTIQNKDVIRTWTASSLYKEMKNRKML